MENILSTDHFKTFDSCEYQYYLKYIRKIKLPFLTNQQIKKGKVIHALMQYKLNGLEIEHIEKDLEDDFKNTWQIFKSNEILKNVNILTEWEFNLAIEKTWITGRIDAIFKDQSDYIIADWKTSLKSVDTDINYQNMIYSLAFYEIKKKELNLAPEQIKFIFVAPDKNIEFKFDEKKATIYKKILENKINQIKTSLYKKTSEQKNCQYCSFKDFCEDKNAV